MGQPITAAPLTEVPYGLGAWVGSAAVQNLTGADPLDPDDRAFGGLGYGAEGEVCRPKALTSAQQDCVTPRTDVPVLPVGDYSPTYSSVPGKAFQLEAGVKCSTFGQPVGADLLDSFHAKADRALDMLRWQLVAYELWTGTAQPTNQHFDSGADPAVVLSPTPVRPVEAMSLLADSFGVYLPGGPRLIHMPVRLVAFLDCHNQLKPQGSRLYDVLGNGIIADDGYPGTGPGGAEPDDGAVWVYATGPLTVRLAKEVQHPAIALEDAVEASTNDVQVRSLQLALATFLCGKVAVQVQLTE